MACLKGLIELVLTHVRLTLQVDVLFYANEIAASTFVRIEVSSLIGSRTPFLAGISSLSVRIIFFVCTLYHAVSRHITKRKLVENATDTLRYIVINNDTVS